MIYKPKEFLWTFPEDCKLNGRQAIMIGNELGSGLSEIQELFVTAFKGETRRKNSESNKIKNRN